MDTTVSPLPLLTHADPEATVAWRDGSAVSVGAFLAAAHALAARLPAGEYALNLCNDRLNFALAFTASLLRGQCTLLPGAAAPELIRRLHERVPDLVCLADGEDARERLSELRRPVVQVDAELSSRLSSAAVGEIPAFAPTQVVAQVFTSGSTGVPIGHRKTWGQLLGSIRVGAERLHLDRPGWAIVGTVPAQHMYGFESTVLLPLLIGGSLCAARPFFPADVASALESLPRPRALISTPIHLRALVDSSVALPATDLIVSATAMLPLELAQEVERRYATELMEIYGSTETGQMASRRTASEHAWTLWPEVRLRMSEDACWASGGHLPEPMRLADALTPLGTERFLLRGRSADLVNIAGKRSSLAYLGHQLMAIPGVRDGVFFVREDAPASVAGVVRLAAFVVAPGLDAERITAALRERIDPVFLPRPLLLVDHLPRNATGKLPHQRIRNLAERAAQAAPELFT